MEQNSYNYNHNNNHTHTITPPLISLNWQKLLGITLTGLCLSSTGFTTPYSELYVFGDSLSDSGNLSGLKFTNRVGPDYQNSAFADIAIEHTATALGITLAPLTSGGFASNVAANGGTNHAVGGNQSDQILASVDSVGTYTPGIANPPQPIPPFPSFIFRTGIGMANPDALYYINGGGNDVLQNNTAGIAATGSNLVGAAEALTTRGATTIVISNLPDVSQSPATVVQGSAVQAAVLQTVTQVNTDILTQANASDANILIMDTFGINRDIINNPERFGFTTYGSQLSAVCFDNIQDAVCSLTPVDGQISSTAPNPDLFAFNDAIHPSASAQAILGDYYSSVLLAPLEISLLPRLGMDSIRQQWASTRYLQPPPLNTWRAFANIQDGERDRERTLNTLESFGHDYRHLVLGTQYRLDKNWGLVFSVGKSDGEQTFNSGTEIDQGSFLYAIDSIYHQNRWKLETSLTHANTEFDEITRRFALGTTSGSEQGRTEGTTVAMRMELAWAALLRPHWSVTPLIGFEYQHADTDAYRENTTQSTALNFDKQTQISRRFTMGLASAWQCKHHPVTLASQLIWITEKADDTQTVRVGLNTQTDNSAVLRGFTPENQGLELDLNINYQLNPRTSIGAGVALEDWETLSTTVGINAQVAL